MMRAEALLGPITVLQSERGKGLSVCGRLPWEADFFQDHFPDFPVLPGVLALELLKNAAACYLEKYSSGNFKEIRIEKVKAVRFSSYLRPGDEWEGQLDIVSMNANQTEWAGRLLHKGRSAVTARLILNAK